MHDSRLEFAPKPTPAELQDASGAVGRMQSRTPESGAESARQLEAELELHRNILKRLAEVTSEAARGNLEVRLTRCEDVESLRTVARGVNHLLDMTDAFLREIGAALEHAGEGKFFRRVLLRGMRGTFRHKSKLINDATERIKRNLASLKEVEQLVSSSARIAQDAVRESGEASAVVKGLGESSTRIGEAVKSISQIAWQTKLLAFNARIEASRAGEAGRGFEVVAQEVKNLAQQTATATDGISREIATIRKEVERTTQAIEAVNKTIGEMQEISAGIERAVVEQTKKTQHGSNS